MADEQKVSASADASFLIALEWLGLLETLGEVYLQVFIANAVWLEFSEGASADSVRRLESLPNVVRIEAQNLELVRAFATFMDVGEAEALVVAQETAAPLLLMDDLRGRKAAQRLGLRTRGVLGHLLLLKQEGLIASVLESVETLRSQGFYLSAALVEEVLRAAGEL